ncbi:MAG: zf-TFIIB domain-containing protein, partial [Pseudomonadota bacterium]
GAGIDVCREGCRGLWFEAFELKKLDKQDGGQGRGLEAALREPLAPEGFERPLRCPRCKGPMQAHGYRGARDILVDECYKCGGIFLTAGKLGAIRDALVRLEQREQARADQQGQNDELQKAMIFLSTASRTDPGKLSRDFLFRIPPWIRIPGFIAIGAILISILAMALVKSC